MRKLSTPYLLSPQTKNQKKSTSFEFSPSDETVNKILQFAASYRVEKVPENHLLEYFLN